MSDGEIEFTDKPWGGCGARIAGGARCPHCEYGGFKIRARYRNAAGVNEYTDDDGRLHHHDPNLVRLSIVCDACHKVGYLTAVPFCWCGWTASA